MAQTIQDALTQADIYTDNRSYRFVQFPANGITVAAGIVAEASLPFTALLVDKDEVTLMLPQEVIDEFENRFKYATISDIDYRLITFDVVLEPTLIGFMAHITQALAGANISVMPFAAYSRDHIFVPAQDIDRAIQTLSSLQ
jgi:hypothetical protein